jgi:hypothetical protein
MPREHQRCAPVPSMKVHRFCLRNHTRYPVKTCLQYKRWRRVATRQELRHTCIARIGLPSARIFSRTLGAARQRRKQPLRSSTRERCSIHWIAHSLSCIRTQLHHARKTDQRFIRHSSSAEAARTSHLSVTRHCHVRSARRAVESQRCRRRSWRIKRAQASNTRRYVRCATRWDANASA